MGNALRVHSIQTAHQNAGRLGFPITYASKNEMRLKAPVTSHQGPEVGRWRKNTAMKRAAAASEIRILNQSSQTNRFSDQGHTGRENGVFPRAKTGITLTAEGPETAFSLLKMASRRDSAASESHLHRPRWRTGNPLEFPRSTRDLVSFSDWRNSSVVLIGTTGACERASIEEAALWCFA